VITYSWLKEEWLDSQLAATGVEIRGDPPAAFARPVSAATAPVDDPAPERSALSSAAAPS
jgi:hypothetical protein